MKRSLLLTGAFVLVLFISSSAQMENKDSLSLIAKIEEDKAKITELQTQLEERLKTKGDAIAQAQKSANANSTAADKLSDDPRNRKLAKRADKSSSTARKDAKTARRETDRVEKLEKNIRSTKKRMAKNQSRLDKLVKQAKADAAKEAKLN